MASRKDRTDAKTGDKVTRRQDREDERVIREAREALKRKS
jgi:hypothetical protein